MVKSKIIQIRFGKYYISATCFFILFGCKAIAQDVIKHNYIAGERNYGDLFYNDLLDVSIDVLGNVTYEDVSKVKKNNLKKRIGNFKGVAIDNLMLSFKTDQNLETLYFFEKIEKPIDTIVHEKLVKNDSINGIVIFEKQKGTKKIVCVTRMLDNVNNLKKASENIERVQLDSTNLSKLSIMRLYNYYTIEPHKNFLQGREKIKDVPLKDPKKLMLKEPLYLTINSFMSNNKEYDSLIKDYESKKDDFNNTVLNSLSGNEVKKDEDVFAAIADIVSDNQIIMLNEDHFYPKHRLFAMHLLDILKQKGFTDISMETFVPNNKDNTASIPNSKNGFYIKDPYFGHFVRKANALGFNLFGHENYEQSVPREIGQAKNIMKILEKNPKAKIFIYVGHGHLEKEGESRVMASYLKEYSKIDPITINQETVMGTTKEKLVLLPKSIFAKDTLMKSSADYFLINNIEANLKSVYPNEVFKKVVLEDKNFNVFKDEELLVEIFLSEEYNKTKNADLLVPIESTLTTIKDGKIEINLPVGKYYITVKSVNDDRFKFDNIEVK
jgi:hypothetical protein